MKASRQIAAAVSLLLSLVVVQVAQAQTLSNQTLTITGSPTTFGGLTAQYWPLSPGNTSANLGNGSGNTTWDTTSATTLQNTVNAFGNPIVQQILPNNTTPTNIGGGPGYGAPNNPFGGANPATGYVGGIDFPNSGNNQNAFAATGVNMTGQGGQNGGAPNYTPNQNNLQYNSITAEWSGTVNIPAGGGTLNFNVDSDDFSAVVVNGSILASRGNGGTGFSGNGNGGGGTGSSVVLPAGPASINVFYNEGGGGWGVVGLYSFTPTAGSAGPTGYIGNDDNTDGVTFTSSGLGPASNGAIESAAGTTNTLTVNSTLTSSTTGQVTLDNGTTLNVNGSATLVTFGGTVLNGTSMTINNTIPVEAGLVTSSGGWGPGSTLTAAGSGALYLDNIGNASTFIAGTTISSTNPVGAVVGVNIGGTDSLGAATLNLNGGNFSLGTDGGARNFANPISVTGGGGTISAQTAGAGAANNGSVNLTGGIQLNANLNLYTGNGYTIGINSPIVGGGSINANGAVNINAASSSFSGTYSVNGGTTTENVVGGFGPSSGGAFVNVNGGGNLNMNAAGDNLGRGANVNNGGNLNLNAGGINLTGTNINGGGSLNLNTDQGASGGIGPSSITGTVNVNTFQSAGYNLSMGNGSTIQSNGTQTFAGSLALQGNVNVGTNNTNLNLTGNLTGSGGLTQNGTGTTTLSGPTGSASYNGTTNVSAGTLALQTNLTGGGNMAVASGATLNIGANGSLGTSALTTNGLTTLTANGASLGSGPIAVNSGGELRFATGSGNTGTYTGASIAVNDGNLHVASGNANLGNAVITGNLSVVSAGLTEGRILGNSFDTTSPNPGNGGVQPGPLLAYSNNVQDGQPVSAHTWSDTTTWVYTGQINITAAEAASGITFAKSIDDSTSLKIDGNTLINNGNWNEPQGIYVTGLSAGLHTFELRMGNGTGGAGYDNQGGVMGGPITLPGNVSSSLWLAGTTLGLGFGFSDGNTLNLPNANVATDIAGNANGGTLSPMFNNGTGNLFQVASVGSTINIDAGTSLTAGSIASAQQLNLNGSLTLSSTSASVSTVANATIAGPATLNLGANNSFNAGSTTITDGNSLTLGGPGRFNVLGGQTMTIGSSNSATALNVNGGVFHVDGTVSGPGLVNVNSGGTIGGAGNIGVAVHINSGGILAPGDAANTTVGSLTLADNSTMTYNLNLANVEHMAYNPSNGNDLTTVTNSNGLAISSNAYVFGTDGTTLNVIAGANFTRGTYELLAYTGTFTGSLSSFGIGSAPAGYGYQFVNLLNPGGGGGQIDLNVVPEPSAVVLMVLGLVGLGIGYRRRLAKRAA